MRKCARSKVLSIRDWEGFFVVITNHQLALRVKGKCFCPMVCSDGLDAQYPLAFYVPQRVAHVRWGFAIALDLYTY